VIELPLQSMMNQQMDAYLTGKYRAENGQTCLPPRELPLRILSSFIKNQSTSMCVVVPSCASMHYADGT